MNNKYKSLSIKEKRQFLKYLPSIAEGIQIYNNLFVGKKIIFYINSDKYIELIAEKSNFMHLCGIKYTTGAKSFYKDALNKKIDIHKVLIKGNGTTFQKLQVIANLKELLSKNVQLVEQQHFLYLKFDYALKTNKQILALTLINDGHIIRPQSLLNLKRTKKHLKGKPIIKITLEDLRTKEIKQIFKK